MKQYSKKIGYYNYKVEEFSSVLELQRTNEIRPVNSTWKKYQITNKEIADRTSFFNCSSKQEAYKLLTEGWQEGVNKVNKNVQQIQRQLEVTKTKFYNDVHGFAPVVPLALLNVPNSMINSKRVPTKAKVISIIYDFCGLGKVTAKELFDASVEMLKVFMELEAKGYRTDVKIARCNVDKNANEVNCMLVQLKNANQPLNLKKMMFPIANPSWFRVISFDWQDKTPLTADHYIDGRGASYYSFDGKYGLTDENMNKVFGNNSYYFNFASARLGATSMLKTMNIK